jgi:hypothetical protein
MLNYSESPEWHSKEVREYRIFATLDYTRGSWVANPFEHAL